MGKVGGQRNFGYGKTMAWAAKNALHDRYGCGRFATQATHLERWNQFVVFIKALGIKDARNVTGKHISEYAHQLSTLVQCKSMSVAYAQNLLSSVNVVLESMRGDQLLRVSPAELVGERSNVRQVAPVSKNREKVNATIHSLIEKNEKRVAAIVLLARELGLRFREASLIDAKQALHQAREKGYINITEGTKGGRGREIDRWVPITQQAKFALETAVQIEKEGRNIIPQGMSFSQWRDHAYYVWSKVTATDQITGFHDFRAAYACERYEQITGHSAPVISGERLVDKRIDKSTREIISNELGHSRLDVTAAYLGSSR